MKITSVETFIVPPRWLFCRVATDDGVVGWGEPVVEGRADTVRAAVEELAELVVGKDPRRIEDLWQLMTKAGFYRGGAVLASAVAGIDQALWDILGKTLDVPVYQLLGGAVREYVRVYGWIGGDEPAEVADAAAEQVAAGLTAVKMNASGRMSRIPTTADVDEVVSRLSAVRDVLGDTGDIGIDFHGRFSLAGARRVIPELTELRPMFVEEPVLPEYTYRIGEITSATSVPIACGERLFSRTEFLPALQGGIAVAQPDLSHAGGISEVRRIASLAETFDVVLAPHCPLGPISLAASLHVAFATPNFLIQETSVGMHYNGGIEPMDYMVDSEPFTFHDGTIRRWERPGLGVEIDEQVVRDADARGSERWHAPVWRHPDGSFAEW
jgi:galactonate dehydratase